MPIKGLTDRVSIKPQFPSLGKLRKGGPKPNPQTPGKELDHWRFTSANEDVVTEFYNVYGKEPRIVNVYLPYAGLEDCFSTWKEKWAAGGLEHRCDGETCQIRRTPTGYTTAPAPCPGGCKEVGRLIVVVPELVQAGHIGTVTMETHGNHDLRAITGVLLAIESEMQRAGQAPDLRGVPFSLARVQEEVSTPGWGENKGKRVRVKKWNVKLWPHRDMAREMLMTGEPVKALPAGHIDFETGEIIDHEEATYTAPPIPQLDGTAQPAPAAKSRIVINAETVAAAMAAKSPSGKALSEGTAMQWAIVANNKSGQYSDEVAQHARVLIDAPDDMLKAWHEANEQE